MVYNSAYDSNRVLPFYYGGALTVHDTTLHNHGSKFKNNVAIPLGGAIYLDGSSIIVFSETCILANNRAVQGGAIYLDAFAQCFIAHKATVIIANNTALDDGGGIYLSNNVQLILHNYSMLSRAYRLPSAVDKPLILYILENLATKNGGEISYISILNDQSSSHLTK